MKGIYWFGLAFALAVALVLGMAPGFPTSLPTASADGEAATWEVGSDCTETTSNLTRVNYAFDGVTNGTCATPAGASQPGFAISNGINAYAYFDVSAGFMSGASFVRVDVEYFDGAYAASGDTQFLLNYDSTGDAYASSSQKAYLNNSQTYMTATFYLNSVNFANREASDRADFRIVFLNGAAAGSPLYFRKITVTRSTSDLTPSYASAPTVGYQAPDSIANRQGLYPVNFGDGHTTASNSLGRPASVVSDVGDTDHTGYAYFNVDDTYLYQGGSSYSYASIQVSYYDGGTGRFFVQYDSSLDTTGFTSSESAGQLVFLTGSNSWVTSTLYLSNVYFGNREGSLADFRLYHIPASGDTYRLTFDRVVVTRSTSNLMPSYASAETVSFTSPSSESGLYRVTAAGSDGLITTNIDFGRVASQVSSSGYASFNIDDTYVYQGKQGFTSYPYASVEVSYYDKGTGYFLIEYDGVGTSGAYTAVASKEYIFLTDSSQWITHTFYLSNTYFGNRQGVSTDFRINYQPTNNSSYQPSSSSYRLVFDRVTLRRSATDLTPSYASATNVSFRSPNLEGGIRLRSTTDNPLSSRLITDTLGVSREATQVSPRGYAFFDVDDSFIYNGNYRYATVQVSYFDQGYGRFYLTYDSSSSLASDPTAAQSFDQELQSNNVAYLTNSQTWKSYTFYLSNVKFANRQLLGLSDLQLVYPMGADATIANQSYRLAVDQLTVTRSNTAPDRTASLVGNYPGFGDPVVVWTRLAQANEEGHGLWQNDSVADGGTTAATQGSQQSRQNSPGGYIYFDVNDSYIKNGNAYNVWVTVEYFDNGTNTFYLDYDSTSGASKAAESVSRTGSNTWKRHTFYLNDAYFGNRQNGGSDFRLAASSKDLYVKTVYVQRAPGSQVLPRSSSVGPSSVQTFSTNDRVVATHYFPVFDYYYPTLWEASTVTPTATLNQGFPVDYSWRNVATLKNDLEDMKVANIDMAMVWYQGNTSDATFGGVQAVKNLVAAAQQVSNPPKIGLLLDGVHIYTEKVLKDYDVLPDATTTIGKSLFLKLAEDFYSLVPSNLWATVNGRPIITIYAPPSDEGEAANYDASTIQFLYDGLERSLGVRPYLLCDAQWDPTGSKNIAPDQFFSWSASLYPAGYSAFWSSTAEVGPGFREADNPTPGQAPRERSREDGSFYQRSWAPIIARGPRMVFIETWNYWVEGSGIADSIQYGRQYITATAQLAQAFKSASYSSSTSISAILGSTNSSSGLYQDELSNAATSPVTVGGKEGRKAAGDNIFFAINDSFIYGAFFPVDITVEYYDGDSASGGTDWFAIQYDSTGGAHYPDSPILNETMVDIKAYGNTKTWKTKTFHIANAYFGNRQANRNDFVLKSPGGLVVRQVTVTRPAILSLSNKVYVPLAVKSASGW